MKRRIALDENGEDPATASWIISRLKQMIVLIPPQEQQQLLDWMGKAVSSGDLEQFVGQAGDEPLSFTPSPFENEKRLGTDAKRRLRLAMDRTRRASGFERRYPDAVRIRVM